MLNAVSFLASALWIRSMRFAEPHAAGAPPFHARELVDFSPILEGLRYIRSDRRVLTTVFVKCGIGFTGANNVILPLMGTHIFPVHWAGLAPERGAMLGMSLLVGARGVGALFGPMMGGAWAGEHTERLRTGILIGYLMAAAGYMSLSWAPTIGVAFACVVLANFGMSSNWVFSTTLLQTLHGGPLPRPRLFGRDRTADPHDCDQRLPGRCLQRLGSAGAHAGICERRNRADSRCRLGHRAAGQSGGASGHRGRIRIFRNMLQRRSGPSSISADRRGFPDLPGGRSLGHRGRIGMFRNIQSDRARFRSLRIAGASPRLAGAGRSPRSPRTNLDLPEHDERRLVVQLQSDRARLRSLRIAGLSDTCWPFTLTRIISLRDSMSRLFHAPVFCTPVFAALNR